MGCDLSGLQQFDAPTPRAWLLLEEDGRRTLVGSGAVTATQHHQLQWWCCTAELHAVRGIGAWMLNSQHLPGQPIRS
jgi:hypothetical protein